MDPLTVRVNSQSPAILRDADRGDKPARFLEHNLLRPEPCAAEFGQYYGDGARYLASSLEGLVLCNQNFDYGGPLQYLNMQKQLVLGEGGGDLKRGD